MNVKKPIEVSIHGGLYDFKYKAVNLLDRINIFFRYRFIRATDYIAKKIATLFGYPENTGVPVFSPYDVVSDEAKYRDYLPAAQVPFPPTNVATNYSEILFGIPPMVYVQERVYFFKKTLGYYSYYIDHYKQFYFMPEVVSKFLQLNLGFCLDISLLEEIRAITFAALCATMVLFSWKIIISWVVGFNPYNFPFNILVGFTDTVEDRIDGLFPSILGVAIALSTFISILGIITDSLNFLVFTMPYLPNEGLKSFRLVEREPVQTLVFADIPELWVFHPIPNDVRKYWAYQRPEILTYMELTYKDLNINFRPDPFVEDSSISKLLLKILINILIFLKIFFVDLLLAGIYHAYLDAKAFLYS